ncbi:hypothetical protein H4582DRAFT_2055946 [Lactarius indigo]|nr:hypothetical protein H4582DRAFT_2055946 [Lactarius indigo]
MLLEDSGEHEYPLLPSLTKLDLAETTLSAHRTLCLCNTLMKRVEQGVPLETLDLSKCLATSRTIELLSEIVVDIICPEKTLKKRAQKGSMWDSAACGFFVKDDSDSSGVEEYHVDDKDNSNTGSDDEVWPGWHNWGSDSDRDGYDEYEMDYWHGLIHIAFYDVTYDAAQHIDTGSNLEGISTLEVQTATAKMPFLGLVTEMHKLTEVSNTDARDALVTSNNDVSPSGQDSKGSGSNQPVLPLRDYDPVIPGAFTCLSVHIHP